MNEWVDCLKCRFYVSNACRRHAPHPFVYNPQEPWPVVYWPTVSGGCGEGEERNEVT